MSVSSIQSSLSSVQREIQQAQRKLTDKSKEEAKKTGRIATIQRSITKHTSASSLASKARETERLQDDIARIQKVKADLTKTIASKTERLHSLQNDLFKAQQREQNAALKKLEESKKASEREQQRRLANFVSDALAQPTTGISRVPAEEEHDVFISHASEDKDEVVRPLAEALKALGLDVWYDEFRLSVGDSLRRSIDKGLAASRFGIVVLSPAFFAKQWPQYELDGLVQKEMLGDKVILPIWHKTSKTEVISYSPSLADKIALSTATLTPGEIAAKIAEVLGSG